MIRINYFILLIFLFAISPIKAREEVEFDNIQSLMEYIDNNGLNDKISQPYSCVKIFGKVITILNKNGDLSELKLRDPVEWINGLEDSSIRSAFVQEPFRFGICSFIGDNLAKVFLSPKSLISYFQESLPLVKSSKIDQCFYLQALISCLEYARVRQLSDIEKPLSIILVELSKAKPELFRIDSKNQKFHGLRGAQYKGIIARGTCEYLNAEMAHKLLTESPAVDKQGYIYASCMLHINKALPEHLNLLKTEMDKWFGKSYASYNEQSEAFDSMCNVASWAAFSDEPTVLLMLSGYLMDHDHMVDRTMKPKFYTSIIQKHHTKGSAVLFGLSYLDRFYLRPIMREKGKGDWADYQFCVEQFKKEGIRVAFTNQPWFEISKTEYSKFESGPYEDLLLTADRELPQYDESPKPVSREFLTSIALWEKNSFAEVLASDIDMYTGDSKFIFPISHPDHYRSTWYARFKPSLAYTEGLRPFFEEGILRIKQKNEKYLVLRSKQIKKDVAISGTHAQEFRRRDDWMKVPKNYNTSYVQVFLFQLRHTEKPFTLLYTPGVRRALNSEKVYAVESWGEYLDILEFEYPSTSFIFREGKIIISGTDKDCNPFPGKSIPVSE